jgi:hypothetical protein
MSESGSTLLNGEYASIRSSIVALLNAARSASARSLNALMTATYWEIGRRIVESEMRGEKRADYGERLVERLAVDLTEQFGRGFGKISLWRMRAFFQAWPEKQILSTPLKESERSADTVSFLLDTSSLASSFPLPWSAHLRLIAVKNPEARRFYEEQRLCAPVGRSASWITKSLSMRYQESPTQLQIM